MIDAATVTLIMAKEMREARQNRWFLLFAAIFAGLALTLSLLGLAGLGTVGIAGFGRTAASLVHLVMLVVPLMGLLIGSLSVAGEREQGTLVTLLAQPVVPEEVLLGKFLGLAGALLTTILLGFGLTALVIAHYSGPGQIGDYLLLVGCTFLFGLGYLSIGFFLSTIARKSATAVGVALFVWLVSMFLSDLGLIGTALVLQLSPRSLLWLSLLNPPQAFKLLVINRMHGNLETLGPGGMYATDVFGGWMDASLAAILAGWVIVPLALSVVLFRNRGAA